jgi:hypothetical protein
MNHNETEPGGSAIRWLDQGDVRLMRTEREQAAPSTGPRLPRRLEARR